MNGDGASDVIVGAFAWDGAAGGEGRAYVYHGGATGLSPAASPDWTADPTDQASAQFGQCVSTAGDVNGDGYSEVIVGADGWDGGAADEGRTYVYYGNGGPGLSLRPRQARADGTALRQLFGASGSTDSFRVRLLARSPSGRARVKLQWEVKPLGTLFDLAGLGESPSWIDIGTAGTEMDQLVTGLSANTAYHWRVRLKCSPHLEYGRWFSIGPNGWNETDVRTVNTPPAAPTAASQNRTTGGAGVVTGDSTSEGQIDLSATASDPDATDTFKLQFEVRVVGDAFTSPGTVSVDNAVFFESAFSASNAAQALTRTISGLADGALYHWQVRTLDGAGNASAWVGFGGNAENPPANPAATDFGADTTAPTAAVTADATTTNASPIAFTMTFSEPVTGLTAGEITVTNGTAGALSGGPIAYTIPVTPTLDGAVTCRVTAGAAQDAASNNSTVSNTASVTYDTIAPTVVVTPMGTTTGRSSFLFTMTFNEPVTGTGLIKANFPTRIRPRDPDRRRSGDLQCSGRCG
ncbi:MAG: VCBS repeat-containing protein [Planctomycetes bacterium]|nr:VCBS repeat-containing protein [Planctomycetota bacterium]